MAIKYRHTEAATLTAAQKTKFVTFVTGVWPGAAGDITRAELWKVGSELRFKVYGTMTTTVLAELPDPPYRVEIDGSNYTYGHQVDVVLNASQTTAFVDFVTDTWTGSPGDVTRVEFRPVGTDVEARFVGSKTVATVGDLPAGQVVILDDDA